jgi:hypothetical protein
MSKYTMYLTEKQFQVLERGCAVIQMLYAQGDPDSGLEPVVIPDDPQFRLVAEDLLQVMGQTHLHHTYGPDETYTDITPVSAEPLPVVVKANVRVG